MMSLIFFFIKNAFSAAFQVEFERPKRPVNIGWQTLSANPLKSPPVNPVNSWHNCLNDFNNILMTFS